ncbi:hypothetical protein MCOR07_008901 [Pyricularia oryzae]|uniref:MARVEL domain-containing protein n=3 Tax=Pyricularia oryzae TaxID=318829 RepID=G4NEV9_PYRO7|nr:uncharacterized protein MGG_00733 [Pyricularia oryzae 70-15]ELQ36079.1 hypothetical protein OOU_Y34scaffold00669g64 [Pyricularia oryzae Y34]KAI6252057.1 hypothetical protein MCOR19_011318 [Pyricularia oryzae]EHA48685.1 hypothetical protein MGG_00733 [Pyricularia oryzae 70-15]KAI6264892.1 hypothetical protein MCOR26_011064 [Pyricularia oryzae]KAI6317184.1 hypothetical protein MCOR29_006462 [Pyricularia oryzae]
MGAKAGIALKTLQWFNRGVQFLCSGLILGIFSYFLATFASNRLESPTWVRAVEGISGIAALYSGLALVLLCCLAGRKFVAFLAIVLDVAFVAAFIYVAVQNRAGTASCNSGVENTPFGSTTNSNARISNNGGPTFFTVCKLQSACLAVSIVAIFFFIFSAATEVFLARHRHKENRFGPSPANDYTSGYGKKKGFLGFLKRSGTNKTMNNEDPNALPAHATPADMREPVDAPRAADHRVSYATETTAVGDQPGMTHHANGGDMGGYRNKYGDDDALPMNPPRPLYNPYDNRAYGSSPYVNSTHTASGSLHPGNNFSRPKTAENGGRGQMPRNYQYSDGVYDA